jgi:hypothetical protein
MPHNISLITTIAAALGFGLLFGMLAVRLKLPALVGYLAAGVLIGPATPGFVADVALASQLAEIGVMLLMFGVGLHFSLRDLLDVKRIALPGAILQIAVATAMGIGLTLLWGWSIGAGIVFGLSLSVASTVVLLRALEASGQLDSTLVVVIGDHGEAFGRHNQWGHGTRIYEENLKVPCILINPKLFHGEERVVVGGLVDIAPTILDVIGQTKMPDNWQGRSLFAEGRSNRVYFCAPWSDFLFGYRDGGKKLIYNATKNTFEVFDLTKDPQEAMNLASTESAFIRAGREYMAAWVQYQAKFYERAFRRPPAHSSQNTVTTAN